MASSRCAACRKSLPCIAIVTGNRARLFGFLLQLLDDIGVADLAIRPVVPRDGGSLEPLLRRTHVIRHDGNSFIDIDHLPDALHCQRGLLVHRFRLATEHGRNSNRRNLHTRQSRVDAVERAPIDLYR